MKKQVQRFRARLEKGDPALGWTVVRIPFVPAEVWPERVRGRVQGSIAGLSFRSSLLPDAALGAQVILVNKAMQKGAGVTLGDEVEVLLEPDLAERPAELPDALDSLLNEAEGLRAFYESLSESARREIAKWIDGVKSEASRQKRSVQMAERLLSTMEAELELPPAIMRVFKQRPKAAMGWSKLTLTQRRNELMGVFYYQGAEAREKRIQRLCDVAEKKA
ncbi:MAG: YdeI/OmpD-associated family protein [Acidobacteriaceae bacterium]|nr:YdeI/OmpD-associated family protein [Acidobacteriaceae bacterium]